MLVGSFLTHRPSVAAHNNPFAYLQTGLRRTLSEAYKDATLASSSLLTRLDVRENKDAFLVTADLPGLNESDMTITFDEGVLTIAGEKKIVRNQADETWHVTERSSGIFERQISLSADIDADKITAQVDKGVLTVTMPKLAVEQKSAKKIMVTAGSSAS